MDEDDAKRSETALDASAELLTVLASAARLQEVVPDAVLVGGGAAAFHAGHRLALDDVVADLASRLETVLDAIEATDGWVTLGQLGDIEAGVRELRRRVPLEVAEVELPSGRVLRVPTEPETLRIKGYLVTARNRVRDHLDVAALSARYGLGPSAAVLLALDDFDEDQRAAAGREGRVAAQLLRQLSDPRPRDTTVLTELPRYKQLDRRWHNWDDVRHQCSALADAMLRAAT